MRKGVVVMRIADSAPARATRRANAHAAAVWRVAGPPQREVLAVRLATIALHPLVGRGPRECAHAGTIFSR